MFQESRVTPPLGSWGSNGIGLVGSDTRFEVNGSPKARLMVTFRKTKRLYRRATTFKKNSQTNHCRV